MTATKLFILGLSTAAAIAIFVAMDFAPERPDRDVRIAASCHKEYRENPILVARCVSAVRATYDEEEIRARAQRAYDGSR
jgi:hypothetical protein